MKTVLGRFEGTTGRRAFILAAFMTLVAVMLHCQPALAGDADALVGRWDNPLTDAAYFRFNRDGTYKDVSLLKTTNGKFRVLSNGILELTMPGFLYGEIVLEMKYKMPDNDTLELNFGGTGVKYSRAK